MSPAPFIRPLTDALQTLFMPFSLYRSLLRREIAARYRGSSLGLFWSWITPLVQMATYTLVFVFFFKNQWSQNHSEPAYFVIMLFCGLIPFHFFSESISRAPTLILSNQNYVKRVTFPLQMLSSVLIGSSLFHALIGFGLLLPGILLLQGQIPWTVIALPLVWIPFVLFTLSMTLILAGVGVFIRDLQHGVGLMLNMLFFLSPVFYPASLVPENWRVLLWLNPLSCCILQTREAAVTGVSLNLEMWAWQIGGSSLFLLIVCLWFQRLSRSFADVL